MGNIIAARCKYCQYIIDDLYIGSGWLEYPSSCSYPVLDKENKKITTENILQKAKIVEQHPHYTFYDSEELADIKIPEKERKIECENLMLSASGYMCPKCEKFGITFYWRGLWD